MSGAHILTECRRRVTSRDAQGSIQVSLSRLPASLVGNLPPDGAPSPREAVVGPMLRVVPAQPPRPLAQTSTVYGIATCVQLVGAWLR